ncbi:MAG: hypothetical protein ACREB3_07530 [Burkholderiales bacterium]
MGTRVVAPERRIGLRYLPALDAPAYECEGGRGVPGLGGQQ